METETKSDQKKDTANDSPDGNIKAQVGCTPIGCSVSVAILFAVTLATLVLCRNLWAIDAAFRAWLLTIGK